VVAGDEERVGVLDRSPLGRVEGCGDPRLGRAVDFGVGLERALLDVLRAIPVGLLDEKG
jgi:hypothetical protein